MDRESLAASTARTAAALREQLSQITAVSQLLEQAVAGGRERTYLAVLNQSVCRMLRTIGRMELTHRLTEENEIRVFPALTDLGGMVDELGRQIEGVLAAAGVGFRWQGPQSLLANVDEGLIRYMLLELVSNGAKAGKHVSLTLTQRGDKACFSIGDDGEGVSPEKLTQMFDTEEALEGGGIPVAQRIAELHGGSLMADSMPGRGLTMVAIVPLREELPEGRLKSPAVPVPKGGFDEVLVAFSHLLPAESFLPEELN